MDFNTITANLGPGTVDTGVSCGTVVVPLVFDSNIIFDNIVCDGWNPDRRQCELHDDLFRHRPG